MASSLVRALPASSRFLVRALWVGGLALAAVMAVHLQTNWGEETHDHIFDALLSVTYAFPAALCVLRALLYPEGRLRSLLIGAGIACFGLGYIYYYAQVDGNPEAPYPSAADGLWFSYYALVLAGVLMMMRAKVREMQSGVWIDALVGALALAAIGSSLLVDRVVDATGGDIASIATNLSFPLSDVLILGVILLTFALSNWRPGRRWTVLAILFASSLVFDTIYVFQVAEGTYTAETLLDISWVVFSLGLAWVVWQPEEPAREARPEGWTSVIMPGVFAVVAVALATYGLFFHFDPLEAGLTVAALVLSLTRAFGTFAHARSLTRSKNLLARHALILDSAGEGIIGLDTEGRIMFANAAARRMTGYTSEELLGRRQHELLHYAREDGTPYPAQDCPIVAALKTGAVASGDDEIFWRKDSTSFPIQYTTTPVIEDRQMTGVVCVFRDITERREIDRMKDEFTSIVSHELRTPLTSIRGSLGLLAGGMLGPLGDKAQQMASIAVENTDRLVRLINDMLDIERMHSGALTMERIDCDAGELLEQAIETMRPMATEAGITILSLARPAPLYADPDRMLQTFSNLISNAIKFSPSGSTVTVESRVGAEEVLIRVSDEGRGIPADRLEKVFERFEQVDASDAREKGGTGLGLAICAGIVEQHGGRIWAESVLGQGATFSIALPAARSGKKAIGPSAGPPVRAVSLADERPVVLVCDDDPTLLEVITTMVENHGYRAISATSGLQAIAAAERERPDAVLLDLLMPGMDGWETAAALRRQAGNEEVPVVILSVLTQAESDPVAADVVAWLAKPLHEQELVEALERAVKRGDHPTRILIVEDDSDLAQVLQTTFEHHGLKCHRASTGTEAIEIAQRVQPDLLVLDLGLPEVNGFAVVDWLRRHETLHTTPLLVYTARDLDLADRARLQLGGRTEFMIKGAESARAVEERVLGLLGSVLPKTETVAHDA